MGKKRKGLRGVKEREGITRDECTGVGKGGIGKIGVEKEEEDSTGRGKERQASHGEKKRRK